MRQESHTVNKKVRHLSQLVNSTVILLLNKVNKHYQFDWLSLFFNNGWCFLCAKNKVLCGGDCIGCKGLGNRFMNKLILN